MAFLIVFISAVLFINNLNAQSLLFFGGASCPLNEASQINDKYLNKINEQDGLAEEVNSEIEKLTENYQNSKLKAESAISAFEEHWRSLQQSSTDVKNISECETVLQFRTNTIMINAKQKIEKCSLKLDAKIASINLKTASVQMKINSIKKKAYKVYGKCASRYIFYGDCIDLENCYELETELLEQKIDGTKRKVIDTFISTALEVTNCLNSVIEGMNSVVPFVNQEFLTCINNQPLIVPADSESDENFDIVTTETYEEVTESDNGGNVNNVTNSEQ